MAISNQISAARFPHKVVKSGVPPEAVALLQSQQRSAEAVVVA
jgi:hypothetical protein